MPKDKKPEGGDQINPDEDIMDPQDVRARIIDLKKEPGGQEFVAFREDITGAAQAHGNSEVEEARAVERRARKKAQELTEAARRRQEQVRREREQNNKLWAGEICSAMRQGNKSAIEITVNGFLHINPGHDAHTVVMLLNDNLGYAMDHARIGIEDEESKSLEINVQFQDEAGRMVTTRMKVTASYLETSDPALYFEVLEDAQPVPNKQRIIPVPALNRIKNKGVPAPQPKKRGFFATISGWFRGKK